MPLDQLIKPVSGDSACGPDLDSQFDPDFMNFLARVEGTLPGQFFTRDQESGNEKPFERGSLSFQGEIAAAEQLLLRTRDIRLLVALAKFAALDRKLPDLVDLVETIASLLDLRWDEINPGADGDDFSLRLASLQALDDMTHIVLPLQFTPLIRHPRAGVITFRQKLLAEGMSPREGEEAPDATVLDRAFMEIPTDELIAQRDRFARLAAAAAAIGATTSRHLGPQTAVRLDFLEGLSKKILAFLDDFVRRREPALAAQAESDAMIADAAPDAASQSGPIVTLGDVAATLAGIAAYFAQSEPSSPALLLVKQASSLVGKNLLEVIRILAPEYFDQAHIGVGRNETLDLPLHRLSELFGTEVTEPPSPVAGAVNIADKSAAVAALLQIEAYYARNEPSSPVPFMCERARKFSSADFLTILKEILPSDALKQPGSSY
jgi:type VI secretion system protein ImpA